jgi:glucose-1-phosphate cytidylyltransferase
MKKVVILCGGKGTRLHEETEFKPKPLVKIGGMPILWHIMKIYSAFGYKDFILCLGYKGEMIKDYFLSFEEMVNDFTLNLRSKEARIVYHENENLDDWKITFVDTGLETQTGGRIKRVEKFIGADQDFFLTYGDGLSNINLDQLYQFHQSMGCTLTLTGVHPPSQFGVIKFERGVASSFKEKPRLEGVISGGFFVCNRKIFDYLTPDESCIFEEQPMRNLADQGQLAVFEHQDFWYAMDNQKHVNELNKIWDSGAVPWKQW